MKNSKKLEELKRRTLETRKIKDSRSEHYRARYYDNLSATEKQQADFRLRTATLEVGDLVFWVDSHFNRKHSAKSFEEHCHMAFVIEKKVNYFIIWLVAEQHKLSVGFTNYDHIYREGEYKHAVKHQGRYRYK